MPINHTCFQWAIVGAGPAGIAAVGQLLDKGIPPSAILWIDPYFKVGDLGQLWRQVSSNTSVKRFIDFLNAVDAFQYDTTTDDFILNHLPPEDTCTLEHIVKPLEWITAKLKQQVCCQLTTVKSLSLTKRRWTLTSDTNQFTAYNVILATGSLPSSLNYSGMHTIPFETAIDKKQLMAAIHPSHTIGVFGSSHSAIMIVRHLVEAGIHQIINFYRSPCRYAIDMGEWILFDNTGLKGQTAAWAREHIDGILPTNLLRYQTNDANIARYLPQCQQVVYAVGFERRNSISIGDYQHASYNPHTGIIGPGLFGFGIAYPQLKPDPFGSIETQVGLWKFMVYLEQVLPLWMKYHA